jgi:carbon monoxide dehydrogenase subunit G
MGDTLWSKPYPQLSDPRCLIQTSDGGYAISSYNGWDIHKTDSMGNIQWQTTANIGMHVGELFSVIIKNIWLSVIQVLIHIAIALHFRLYRCFKMG